MTTHYRTLDGISLCKKGSVYSKTSRSVSKVDCKECLRLIRSKMGGDEMAEVQPNGNITKYIKTKSKECASDNRTLVTLARDGSVSFIHMGRPMQSVLLYPDQVEEIIRIAKEHNWLKCGKTMETKKQ